MRSPALLLTAPLLLVLAGCSSGGWLPHQRSGTADDPAALELAWSTPASQPAWVPADATRIQWVASTTGGADRAPAAVRIHSASALEAACAPFDRATPAAIAASWAPGRSSRIVRCGNWAVEAVPGGYYGWTPADGDAAG